MAVKVTKMVLEVDLQCPRCYKKIKKVLCKFPQIRDEVYDEKKNTVTISVACCSPEKIREKLWRKGGKTIKSIEFFKEPPPQTKVVEQDKSKSKGKSDSNPPTADKPPSPAMTPLPVVVYPARGICCGPCYGGCGWGPCTCYYYSGYEYRYGRTPPPPPPPPPPHRNCGCGCGGYMDCCYVIQSDYFSEENTSGCSIM